MVSFICDACGNTVKKNQVEKHYQTQCRNCSILSCIDCGVDFPGDAYVAHTSCITEAEKYQGHLYQAKDKENKGEAKQKEWIQNLQNAGNHVKDPRIRSLLEKITEYSNIPRKKKKFENFCKNSVKVYDERTLNALWDAFSATISQTTPQQQNDKTDTSTNQTTDSDENNDTKTKSSKKKSSDEEDDNAKSDKKSRKKKRKLESDCIEDEDNKLKTKKKKKKKKGECNDENVIEEVDEEEKVENKLNEGKFNWHKAIKVALKQTDDKELPVKKLRKKVIAAYQEHGEDNRAHTLEECRTMFQKKLSTYSKIKVKKEVVKLVK